MKKDKLWVVILQWGSADYLIDCLASLAEVDVPHNTLVFDNGSQYDISAISELYPDVFVLHSEENLGFAKGNNRAVQWCVQMGAEYVLLLNNDTVVDKAFLTYLVADISENDRIGVISPKILVYGINEIWFDGPKTTWLYGRKISAGHCTYAQGALPPVQSVGFVPGCAILIRCSLIKEIGLFDESYFTYYEDLDFCHRAVLAGYEIIIDRRAIIWHRTSSLSLYRKGYTSLKFYYSIHNRLYFMRKYGRWFAWPFVIMKTFFELINLIKIGTSVPFIELLKTYKQAYKNTFSF